MVKSNVFAVILSNATIFTFVFLSSSFLISFFLKTIFLSFYKRLFSEFSSSKLGSKLSRLIKGTEIIFSSLKLRDVKKVKKIIRRNLLNLPNLIFFFNIVFRDLIGSVCI